MPADQIRIVVVDDHPLFREGVTSTLAEADIFEVVGEGGSADDAFRLVAEHLPDIVCLDISMPGGGVEAARRISAEFPDVRIVMLTVSESDSDVAAARAAKAAGDVLKGVGAFELVAALTGVARGGSYVSPNLAARLLAAAKSERKPATHPIDTLTDREERILQLLASGLSNREIGLELALREKTVKHYMSNILQKLHVRNRVEAALIARDRERSG